jgi:hypothetical protein
MMRFTANNWIERPGTGVPGRHAPGSGQSRAMCAGAARRSSMR